MKKVHNIGAGEIFYFESSTKEHTGYYLRLNSKTRAVSLRTFKVFSFAAEDMGKPKQAEVIIK